MLTSKVSNSVANDSIRGKCLTKEWSVHPRAQALD